MRGTFRTFADLLTASSFWASAGALVVSLWTMRRPQTLLWDLLDRRWVAVLLVLAALPALILALDMSYAAPRDFMQDIVSGERLWQGRSLYPIPMTGEIRAMLEQQPARWPLGRFVPALGAQEQRAYEQAVSQHWVQAHPPLMSVLAALPERLLGARAAVLLMNLISLACVPLAVHCMVRGAGVAVSRVQMVSLCALLAGWYPVLNLIRLGQSGLVLTALVAFAWYRLRQGREVSAGLAIGFAAALKLYPALLFGYLLVRARKGLVAALAALAAAGAVVLALAGPAVIHDYLATIRFVTAEYAGYLSNYSLLGLLVHTGQRLGVSEELIRGSYPLLAAALVVGVCVAFARRARGGSGRVAADDAFYGTLVALMPLVSPIAWQHYWTLLFVPVFLIGCWVAERAGMAAAALFCGLLTLLSIPEPVFNDWLPYCVPSLALMAAAAWTASLACERKDEAVETYWRTTSAR